MELIGLSQIFASNSFYLEVGVYCSSASKSSC